ncbi:hypothetical protein Adt_32987 [Abeliophyllum distichum]|uniref:Uncharacterized protein n=1 Tax=Abeliophyllum distichum TaxID=126358 RepID=A0ABD1QUY6_9LAMI
MEGSVAEVGNSEIGGLLDAARVPEGAGSGTRARPEFKTAGDKFWDAIDPSISTSGSGASIGDWLKGFLFLFHEILPSSLSTLCNSLCLNHSLGNFRSCNARVRVPQRRVVQGMREVGRC